MAGCLTKFAWRKLYEEWGMWQSLKTAKMENGGLRMATEARPPDKTTCCFANLQNIFWTELEIHFGMVSQSIDK